MGVSAAYAESELVALLKSGSKASFDYLYENYSGALYSVILAIVSDAECANDVLQVTFVKIWKQMASYDESRGRLYTWMLQIARNSALDLVRTQKFQANRQNRELTEAVYEKGGDAIHPDSLGLRDMVRKLKKEQSELIELAYFNGLTQEEMAEALQIPLGTVKTRLRAALVQLRKIYKP